MKTDLLKLLKLHLQGEAAKHKANLTVYFNNPAGIGEHPDVVEAMRENFLSYPLLRKICLHWTSIFLSKQKIVLDFTLIFV